MTYKPIKAGIVVVKNGKVIVKIKTLKATRTNGQISRNNSPIGICPNAATM